MTITRHNSNQRMSQLVIHGNVAYLAGQVGDNHYDSAGDQTRQVLAKIDALLALAGTDKSKVLSAQIWVDDMRKFDDMNKAWDEWVSPGNAPARACTEARMANPGWFVEIMVTAAID
ncbi:MAG: RidA family protein [Rhodospirillales bacterium]|nr:RidA family protein [Rhodospirillales bacterium]